MLLQLLIIAFTALAAARTDLSGCVSSETVAYGGASLIWYVPGTGEVCAFLDCGGGTAPPITTQPGCAAYSGTATYSPSYLPDYGSAAVSSTTYESATTTFPSTSMITGSQTTAAVSESGTAPEIIISSSSASSGTAASTGLVTSTTPMTTSSVSGSRSTSSSNTKSSSATSTSSGTAASSSSTGNAGAVTSLDGLYPGIMGVVAAGFAFLL